MLWFIVLYGITAMGIGSYKYLKCSSVSDYILGNRHFPAHSAGLASQTALLGYLFTVTVPMAVLNASVGISGAIFSAAGMVCGIFLSRLLVSKRIRIYSELAGDSKSFPEYLENRFRDRSGILRAVCSAIIFIFNIIFAANVISVSADILNRFTDMGNTSATILCGLIIAIFVFLGGFSAITATGYIKAVIIFVFFAFIIFSGVNSNILNPQSSVRTGYFLEAAKVIGETSAFDGLWINILRFFSYSAIFFGIPTVNTIYMSTKERRVKKRSIIVEAAWTVPAAVGAVICGVIAKTSAEGIDITAPDEYVVLLSGNAVPIIGAAIMSLIFIVCLSTSENAVFSAATAFSYDLFSHGTNKKSNKTDNLLFTRSCAVLVTISAVIYALIEKNSSFFTFDFVLMLISATFGPTTIFGLYSGRLTSKAAVISIAGGIISACVSNYFLPANGLPVIIGMIPSFAIGSLLLFAVSFLDRKNISPKTKNEFGRTKELSEMK